MLVRISLWLALVCSVLQPETGIGPLASGLDPVPWMTPWTLRLLHRTRPGELHPRTPGATAATAATTAALTVRLCYTQAASIISHSHSPTPTPTPTLSDSERNTNNHHQQSPHHHRRQQATADSCASSLLAPLSPAPHRSLPPPGPDSPLPSTFHHTLTTSLADTTA